MTDDQKAELDRLTAAKKDAVTRCTALLNERNRLTRELNDAQTASIHAQNDFEEYRRRLIREGALEVVHSRPDYLNRKENPLKKAGASR